MIKTHKVKRRRYLSYLFTTIIVFSMASFWLFYFKNIQRGVAYNSFLHLKVPGHHTISLCKFIVGLFSLQNEKYRLSFDPNPYPITSIMPERAEGETQRNLVIHESDDKQSVLISLDRWSHCRYPDRNSGLGQTIGVHKHLHRFFINNAGRSVTFLHESRKEIR